MDWIWANGKAPEHLPIQSIDCGEADHEGLTSGRNVAEGSSGPFWEVTQMNREQEVGQIPTTNKEFLQMSQKHVWRNLSFWDPPFIWGAKVSVGGRGISRDVKKGCLFVKGTPL